MWGRTGTLLVTKIAPDQLGPLRAVLTEIGGTPADHPDIPFGRMTTVHFARWVILDAAVDARGAALPAQLLFATDADAPLDRHVEELVEIGSVGLDRVYGSCADYPVERTRDSRLEFLRRHLREFGALYEATHGLSVTQIREEAALREAIEDFLDTRRDAAGLAPDALRASVIEFVASQPALRWALTPAARTPPAAWHVQRWATLAGAGLLWLALLPITIPLFVVWLIVLRRHERRDPETPPADSDALDALNQLEDVAAQNHMTIVGNIKPDRFRRVTMRTVLIGFNFIVRFIIPRARTFFGVESVHFGRFFFLDDRRRLAFLSSYDGSWESYIGDFIDRLSYGITAVWSNAVGFPRTRFLLLGGAQHERNFKALVRTNQLPSQVWYAAYDRLTVKNINDNARIRHGLSRSLGRAETRAWLALF